jgi:hypothetical protein
MLLKLHMRTNAAEIGVRFDPHPSNQGNTLALQDHNSVRVRST